MYITKALRKLSEFLMKVLVYLGKFSGGDKPRPYVVGKASSVGAVFIPARRGLKFEQIAQFWC
jgi:hypothetical protein